MTLIELYNLKLNEYKETGVRERPWKLLAMLLLSEINKYEPARNSRGEFYKKYKDEIDKKIAKVERDFNFTYEDIVEYIERIVANPNDFYKIICDELTAEERVFILKQLENKCCMNCTNGSCRVEYDEKVGVDEFGKPQGSECVGWFNAELIGRSKVLRKTDINKLR